MAKKLTQNELMALRMLMGDDEFLSIARTITTVTGCPVVGGVAVFLHGYRRTTKDIDIYSTDFWATHEKMEAAGIMWNAPNRAHVLGGVPILMVKDDSLGGPPKHISTINGIKVIGLADLVRGKLTVGLENVNRSKDLADVVELIRAVPLKKDFAPKLPKHLRAPFKELVDQVHAPRRTTLPPRSFLKKFAAS